MPLQIARLLARIITYNASKGLLANVRKSVIHQTVKMSAREVALIARKGFLTSMLPHVSLEITSIVA